MFFFSIKTKLDDEQKPNLHDIFLGLNQNFTTEHVKMFKVPGFSIF